MVISNEQTPSPSLSLYLSTEDSGNSSEDSDSEEPPDKKPSPWRGRTEAPPCLVEEQEVKEEEKQSDLTDVTVTTNSNITVALTTAGHLPAAAASPCPSIPQEKADKGLSQSEKRESEQGEGPVLEVSTVPVPLDKENEMSPVHEYVMKTPFVTDKDKVCDGQEVEQGVIASVSPGRTSPPAEKKLQSSFPRDTTNDDANRATSLSSPKGKGRRPNLRESGNETPPRIPLCISSPVSGASTSPSRTIPLSSPPRSVLKRQEEPMVVLHCLPTQSLPLESPTADSDTDSATEEEEEAPAAVLPDDRNRTPPKHKSIEQRLSDKKLRPDKRKEEVSPTSPQTPPTNTTPKMAAVSSPKCLPSPLTEASVKTEEMPREEMELTVEDAHTETPLRAPEAPGPAPSEEPQMGPEALVCHEVDLDDPDEKEKPASLPDHLLLMMREQQQAPTPLPHLLHPTAHLTQLSPSFLPASLTGSTPCPDEHLPAQSGTEEVRGSTSCKQEGDADSSPGFDGSSSSSTSLLSLQDTRGVCFVLFYFLSPLHRHHPCWWDYYLHQGGYVCLAVVHRRKPPVVK